MCVFFRQVTKTQGLTRIVETCALLSEQVPQDTWESIYIKGLYQYTSCSRT